MTHLPSPFAGTISATLRELQLPYDTGVAYGLAGSDGAAVFVYFHERTEVPEHRHGPQWGVIVQGEMKLCVGDEARVLRPGDWYDLEADVAHSGVAEAGTALIDFFEEPDRFGFKPSP